MCIHNLKRELDMPDTDYWYDVGSEIARNIIDDNKDHIFKQLQSDWRSWPTGRQEHLAYILGDSASADELALINQMLSSPNKDVAFRAREALISAQQL